METKTGGIMNCEQHQMLENSVTEMKTDIKDIKLALLGDYQKKGFITIQDDLVRRVTELEATENKVDVKDLENRIAAIEVKQKTAIAAALKVFGWLFTSAAGLYTLGQIVGFLSKANGGH